MPPLYNPYDEEYGPPPVLSPRSRPQAIPVEQPGEYERLWANIQRDEAAAEEDRRAAMPERPETLVTAVERINAERARDAALFQPIDYRDLAHAAGRDLDEINEQRRTAGLLTFTPAELEQIKPLAQQEAAWRAYRELPAGERSAGAIGDISRTLYGLFLRGQQARAWAGERLEPVASALPAPVQAAIQGTQLAGTLMGRENALRDIQTVLAEEQETLFRQQTPAVQAARQKEWAALGPEAAWRDPLSWVHGFAETILPMAEGIGAGAMLTAGARAAGSAIAGRELGRRGQTLAAALGAGAGEGLVSGVYSGADLAHEIGKMDQKELSKSPRYMDLTRSVDEGGAGMTHEQARDLLRDRASGFAAVTAGAITSLTGAIPGVFRAKLFKQIEGEAARSRVGAIVKGAGLEALQEAPQSGGEALAMNIARQQYLDPEQDLTEGVWNDMVAGFALGGPIGGFVGGAAYRPPPLTPEQANKRIPDEKIERRLKRAGERIADIERQISTPVPPDDPKAMRTRAGQLRQLNRLRAERDVLTLESDRRKVRAAEAKQPRPTPTEQPIGFGITPTPGRPAFFPPDMGRPEARFTSGGPIDLLHGPGVGLAEVGGRVGAPPTEPALPADMTGFREPPPVPVEPAIAPPTFSREEQDALAALEAGPAPITPLRAGQRIRRTRPGARSGAEYGWEEVGDLGIPAWPPQTQVASGLPMLPQERGLTRRSWLTPAMTEGEVLPRQRAIQQDYPLLEGRIIDAVDSAMTGQGGGREIVAATADAYPDQARQEQALEQAMDYATRMLQVREEPGAEALPRRPWTRPEIRRTPIPGAGPTPGALPTPLPQQQIERLRALQQRQAPEVPSAEAIPGDQEVVPQAGRIGEGVQAPGGAGVPVQPEAGRARAEPGRGPGEEAPRRGKKAESLAEREASLREVRTSLGLDTNVIDERLEGLSGTKRSRAVGALRARTNREITKALYDAGVDRADVRGMLDKLPSGADRTRELAMMLSAARQRLAERAPARIETPVEETEVGEAENLAGAEYDLARFFTEDDYHQKWLRQNRPSAEEAVRREERTAREAQAELDAATKVIRDLESENMEFQAAIDDWASREYKQNKRLVDKPDIYGQYGGRTTISAANERRRQRTIEGYQRKINQNNERIRQIRNSGRIEMLREDVNRKNDALSEARRNLAIARGEIEDVAAAIEPQPTQEARRDEVETDLQETAVEAERPATERGPVEPGGEEAGPGRRAEAEEAPLEAVERYEATESGLRGSRVTIATAAAPIEADYEVVEANSLITSHDANGAVNKAFPQELQPRIRSGKAYQAQIRKIASDLRPEDVTVSGNTSTGAPVIGPDNVVESGNGRTIGIRLAYSKDAAESYRQYLIDNAEQLGLSPEAIEGIRQPVLVRRRVTDVDREQFVIDAGRSTVAEMSPIEKARSDARLIGSFADLDPEAQGDYAAAGNTKFVQDFLAKLDETEVTGLVTEDGRPTRQLIDRIRSTVFWRAYGDERLLAMLAQEENPELKNILGALNMTASRFALAREADANLLGLDVPGLIVDSVDRLMDARAKGTSVASIVRQQDMFVDGDIHAAAVDRLAAAIESRLRSRRALSILFGSLATDIQTAARHTRAGEDMFGLTTPKMEDLIDAAERQLRREYGGETGDLFRQAAAPIPIPRPEPVEEARPEAGPTPGRGAPRAGAERGEAKGEIETRPAIESFAFEGGMVEMDSQADRLRIRFNKKTSKERRDELRRNGFIWAPSKRAWQQSITDNAKRAATDIVGVDFEAEPPRPSAAIRPIEGQVVGTLRREVVDRLGAGRVRALERAGMLRIVQNQEDMPTGATLSRQGKVIGGLWDGKTIWLVADNIPEGSGFGLMLHEGGEHAGMATMLGDQYADLSAQFDSLLADGDSRAIAADRQAQTGAARPEHVQSERLAYLVQNWANDPANASRGVVGLVRRIIRTLRAWWYRTPMNRSMTRLGLGIRLSTGDITALAEASLRRVARTARGMPRAPMTRNAARSGPTMFQDIEEIGDLPPVAQASVVSGVNNAIGGAVSRLGNVSRQDVDQFTENLASASRSGGLRKALNLLTVKQIGDIYSRIYDSVSGYNPLGRLIEYTERLDADKNRLLHDAEVVRQRWAKLPEAERDMLGGLFLDATVEQVHPDRSWKSQSPDWRNASDDEKTRAMHRHRALRRIYRQRLSDAGRQVYQDVLSQYTKQWDAAKRALHERIDGTIEDDEANRRAHEAIDRQFTGLERGPYFPLSRFGDHHVVTHRLDVAGNPIDFERHTFNTESEARRHARIARSSGRIAEYRRRGEYTEEDMRGVEGFSAEVVKLLEDSDAMTPELRDSIIQLGLTHAPEISWRKHMIHRNRTPGWSKDAMRAYSHSMMHGAYYISRIRNAWRMEDALDRLREVAGRGGRGPVEVSEENADTAMAIADHMGRITDNNINPNVSPNAAALNSLGFFWFLGLSPAAAAVNLTQVPLVSFPWLASRTGIGARRAATTLTQAYRDFFNAARDGGIVHPDSLEVLNRNSRLSADEVAILTNLIEDGTLTYTQSRSLIGAAEHGEVSTPARERLARIVEWSGGMFTKAEILNRYVTALAAIRLAPPGSSVEQRTTFAKEAVDKSQFDYSRANRANIMRPNVARVMFQFKQFSQNMMYTLLRNSYQALRGATPHERTEARRMLSLMAGTHFLAAGAMGMPFLSVAFAMVNLLHDACPDDWCDDDEFDARTEFQNIISDVVRPVAGEVGAEAARVGIFNALLGVDVSARVGLNDLIWRRPDPNAEGRDAWTHFAEQAAGPVMGGILTQLFMAQKDFREGNIDRGMERTVPKAVRDLMKTARFGREGALTYSKDPLVEEFSMPVLVAQAFGLSPAELSREYERGAAIRQRKTTIERSRRRLMQSYALAVKLGEYRDAGRVLDKIARWNKRHPHNTITTRGLRASLKARQRASEQRTAGQRLTPAMRAAVMPEVRF